MLAQTIPGVGALRAYATNARRPTTRLWDRKELLLLARPVVNDRLVRVGERHALEGDTTGVYGENRASGGVFDFKSWIAHLYRLLLSGHDVVGFAFNHEPFAPVVAQEHLVRLDKPFGHRHHYP